MRLTLAPVSTRRGKRLSLIVLLVFLRRVSISGLKLQRDLFGAGYPCGLYRLDLRFGAGYPVDGSLGCLRENLEGSGYDFGAGYPVS